MIPTTDQDTKYLNMDLLRFTTAGSVDDGKSTLIGRLLYDSKSIFEDQMEAIEKTSRSSGEEEVNLALLTDGLKAEREQKITIDVAYRYFATPKRKFIIADTPGHTQYTRNMVTGASTAELAIVLIDASRGVLEQSRRHAFLSSLLRIPHLVVAVNKMDLVDYSEQRFNEIVADFTEFARKLEIDNITYIPISALKGDNVVHKRREIGTNGTPSSSAATEGEGAKKEKDFMPWYNGSTLLHHLETVKVDASENVVDFRLPVQYVIRPNQNFRGFSGRVASGRIRPGDEIMVLPSRQVSRLKEIHSFDQSLDEALAGDSVVLTIEDEVDISRGDMIVRKNNVPVVSSGFEAFICWMNEERMVAGKAYLLMHTTRTTQVYIDEVIYRMNVNTMHREEASELKMNEIGRVKLTTSQPLFVDPYQVNQKTGSFIIIDPATNVTVGSGMIRAESTNSKDNTQHSTLNTQHSPNAVWEPWNIPREERERRNGHKAKVFWFTGISGSGKSTIAKALERKLWEKSKQTILLDGDQMRHGLNGDLGFSMEDRQENIRRVGEVARLFYEHGNIVLCTFVSPYKEDRERIRGLFPDGAFTEIHVTCSPETAMERDPKGLYAKAKKGEIQGLTGFDGPYEVPSGDAILLDTDRMSVEECVEVVLSVEF